MDGDGQLDLFQSTIRHWWAGNSTDPSTLLVNQTQNGGTIRLARQDASKNGVTFPHLDPLGWNEGIQQVSLVDMNNDGRHGRPDILTGGSDYAYQSINGVTSSCRSRMAHTGTSPRMGPRVSLYECDGGRRLRPRRRSRCRRAWKSLSRLRDGVASNRWAGSWLQRLEKAGGPTLHQQRIRKRAVARASPGQQRIIQPHGHRRPRDDHDERREANAIRSRSARHWLRER